MKKQFFILGIIFGLLITETQGQTDSLLKIRPHFLNDIETDKRPRNRQIKKLGNYRIERKLNRFERRPYSFKEYYIGDEIEITANRDFFELFNKISNILVKYPAKAITDKGIILGESSLDDVIEKYGKSDVHTFNDLTYYGKHNGRFSMITFIYGDAEQEGTGSNFYIPVKEKKLNNIIIAIRIY